MEPSGRKRTATTSAISKNSFGLEDLRSRATGPSRDPLVSSPVKEESSKKPQAVQASEIIPLLKAQSNQQGKKKAKILIINILKGPALVALLYIFICSLDFLSTSFRLIAGKAAGSIFQGNVLLSNPIVGLMIGILFTVLVQSSSTCTSVIVSMVSSGILNVKTAIPMVMGANVGTSLTSTLVSLTQVTDTEQFERAFAGATVHDCFNWLTVITVLIIEIPTGYLYHASLWLTPDVTSAEQVPDGSHANQTSLAKSVGKASSMNILGTLTKPLTKSIIQIDKSILKCWSLGNCQNDRLLKVFASPSNNETYSNFLLNVPQWSDLTIGIVLLITSMILLSGCLVLIVKLLRSSLQGTVAVLIQKTLNSDIPYCPWLSGYLAILAGAILTFIVQSSSVFTATLTPLVGLGVLTVERVYPLTLGSNLGTTTTALLAALAADGNEHLKNALQIAYCHFLFNVTGIVLFYPIPAMRWPLTLCKILGKTTARYRWFAIFYLTNMFFIVPGIVLGLSLAGNVIFFSVITPLTLLFIATIVINVAQVKIPNKLPEFLTNWDFLPLWMHSLEPMDWFLRYICCGLRCFESCVDHDVEAAEAAAGQNGGQEPATPPNSPRRRLNSIKARLRRDTAIF